MKRAKRTIVILSLALASCRASIAEPTLTPQTISVRILVTTSTAPLLRDLIAAYTPTGTVMVLDSVEAEWQTVYQQVQTGQAPFALVSFLPAESTLWAAPIGQDGLAIIVHPDNPVPALRVDDLRRIFQGRAVSWAAWGGPDAPIAVISRENGADSRLAFDALVMGGQATTPTARLALSSARVVELVASDPQAIGYVSMAFVDQRVRVVPVKAAQEEEAVLPTPQTVSQGRYPLRTPLLIVGAQPPDADSFYYRWFVWMQSAEGQAVIGRRYGMLPLADLEQEALEG